MNRKRNVYEHGRRPDPISMGKHNRRLRYLVQDTTESGHWEFTGLMTAANVAKLLPYFEGYHGQVEIIEDENDG